MRELFSARELEEIRLADLEIDGRPRNRVPAQSIIRLPIEHRDSMDRKRFRNMGQQIMALYRGNEGADSMSETKVVVPEGMLEAAGNIVPEDGCWDDFTLDGILEAALRWLSEHPIVPTDEQHKAIIAEWRLEGRRDQGYKAFVEEWQRRMFRAPEPEVPEAVKDLLLNEAPVLCTNTLTPPQGFTYTIGDAERKHNAAIIEAYRRGLRDK